MDTTAVRGGSEERMAEGLNIRLKENRALEVPTLGTTLSVISTSKDGIKRVIPLLLSSEPGKFLAFFDRDDLEADFGIEIDNEYSPRNLNFGLGTSREHHCLGVKKNAVRTLHTLNDLQLRVTRQSSSEAPPFLSKLAQRTSSTYSKTIQSASQMHFYLSFIKKSRSQPFQITVFDIATGRKLQLEVTKEDNINRVKFLLEEHLGIRPSAQVLVYGGRVLTNYRTLESYRIEAGQRLCLVESSPSPGEFEDFADMSSSSLQARIDSSVGPSRDPWEEVYGNSFYLDSHGERGVIIPVEHRCQTFRPGRDEYDHDDQEGKVNPFTIEFRFEPKSTDLLKNEKQGLYN